MNKLGLTFFKQFYVISLVSKQVWKGAPQILGVDEIFFTGLILYKVVVLSVSSYDNKNQIILS